MDLHDAPDEAAFRAEFRAWLDAHHPGEIALSDFDARRGWQATMAAGGWAAPGWPRSWGGRDAGVAELVVYQEELARATLPPIAGSIGVWNVGPALLEHAAEAQRQRWLPAMLSGERIWCQGFSEPDAGSDLAALKTRAERAGDAYVVNGRKVWISYGDRSDLCFLLCRTDPDVAKHKGLSVLVVDMRAPGVTVSPLRDATGETGFSEVLFEDVRVPAPDRVGEPGDGWRVAMSTLTHERIGTITYGMQLRQRLDAFLARPEAWPADEVARRLREQDVASLWTAVELIRLTALRVLAKAKRGEQPWPDVPIGKLLWSFASQDIAEAACRALALDGLLWPGAAGAPAEGRWAREVVWSRMTTIGAGTTEIQRNVLAERALGLPRD